MTDDELLALINDEIEVCEPECNQHQRINAPWLALRAVVELANQPLDTENMPAQEVACYSYGYNLALTKMLDAIDKELA